MNYPLVQRSRSQSCPSWGRKLSVLALQLLLLLVSSTAVIAGGLEISLAPVGSTSVPAGETRHLALTYNWPSLTTNLSNAKITVPLPAELDPNGVILQNSAHVASSSFDSGTRTITYTMIDPLPAGSSGTFQFCVRFPNGTTAPGTSSLVTATSSATGQPSNDSSVTLTSTATPKVALSKSIATSPALDQKATYQIVVANSQGDGNLNLTNTVVTDTLPAGATFVSATNGGTYDGAGHVTWNVGAVDVWTNVTLRVTVRFPTGSFTEGQDVVNNVELTATPLGGGSVTKNASATVTIAPATPNGYSEKWASDSISSLRAGFNWGLKVVNGGNVELFNYVLTDEFPKEFIPRYFYYGTDLYGTESASVTIEYKTTTNSTWTTVAGSPFVTVPGQDPYVDVNSLGLASGVTVTAVKYAYATLPVGYNTQWTSRVHGFMGDQTTGLDRDGNAITPLPRDPVSNTANYSYVFNGNTTANNVSASTKIMVASAKPDLVKYVSKSDLQPTDVATFTSYMYNNNGSEALSDPVFTDLLSPELEYVAGSYTTGNSLTGGTLEVIPDWNGTGRTLIRCKYTGQSLGVWQYGRVDFSARVKPGTAIASYSNTATMTYIL